MGNVVHRSLDEAIRAAVAEAIRLHQVLDVTTVSRRLAALHGGAGLAAEDIADLLLKAGIEARIPLEWGAGRRHPRKPVGET
jgi:hypothetical protein